MIVSKKGLAGGPIGPGGPILPSGPGKPGEPGGPLSSFTNPDSPFCP